VLSLFCIKKPTGERSAYTSFYMSDINKFSDK